MSRHLVERAKKDTILRNVNAGRANALGAYLEHATDALGGRMNAEYHNWLHTWFRFHPPEIPSVRVATNEVHENEEGHIVRVQSLLAERKRQEDIEQQDLSIQEKLDAILGDTKHKRSGQKPSMPPPTSPSPAERQQQPEEEDEQDEQTMTDAELQHNVPDDHEAMGSLAYLPVEAPDKKSAATQTAEDLHELAVATLDPQWPILAPVTKTEEEEEEGPDQRVGTIRQGTALADPAVDPSLKEDPEAEAEEGNEQLIPIDPRVFAAEETRAREFEERTELEMTLGALDAEHTALAEAARRRETMENDPEGAAQLFQEAAAIRDEMAVTRFALRMSRLEAGGELAKSEARTMYEEAAEASRARFASENARAMNEASTQAEAIAQAVEIETQTGLQAVDAFVDAQTDLVPVPETQEAATQARIDVFMQTAASYDELSRRLEETETALGTQLPEREAEVGRLRETERVLRERGRQLAERGRQMESYYQNQLSNEVRPRVLEMARILSEGFSQASERALGEQAQRFETRARDMRARIVDLNQALSESGMDLYRSEEANRALRQQAEFIFAEAQQMRAERPQLVTEIERLRAELEAEESRANFFLMQDLHRVRAENVRLGERLGEVTEMMRRAEEEIMPQFAREFDIAQEALAERDLLVQGLMVEREERTRAQAELHQQIAEMRARSEAAQAQALHLLEEERRQAGEALAAQQGTQDILRGELDLERGLREQQELMAQGLNQHVEDLINAYELARARNPPRRRTRAQFRGRMEGPEVGGARMVRQRRS